MSARPYVTSVKSNIKGGVSATLTEKTLIVGPNGEGKSAIVNALTLALTGAADDLVGRDVVRDAGIIGLMAPVGEDVRASATLSNGVESSYHSPRTEAGFGKGRQVNTFANAVPLREVREALTGSADKARQFLLSRAARGVTAADVLRVIPEAHHAAYTAAVRAAGAAALAPADQLLAAITATKAAAANAKHAAEAAETLVQSRAGSLGPEPVDADVAQARAEATAAQAAYTAAAVAAQRSGGDDYAKQRATSAHAAAVAAETHAKQVASRALDEHAAMKTALAALDVALPADHARAAESAALWRAVALITDRALTKMGTLGIDSGMCPCCHSMATAAALQGGLNMAVTTLATLSATTEAVARRDALAATLAGKRDSALRAMDALDSAVAYTVACAGVVEKLANVPAPVVVGLADDAAASAALSAATNRLSDMLSARAAWGEVRENRSAGEAARSAQAEAMAVHGAAKDAVEGLLDSAAASFVARVNAVLPPAYRFALQLRDGEKAVCRYGFAASDGGLLSAVSGAEWAMLTAALALACVPDGDTTPMVIIPEERAFDPDTLRAAMVALTDAPAQVIITSPIRPAGRLPAGWSVVEVGATPTEPGGTPPKPRGRPRKVKAETETEPVAETEPDTSSFVLDLAPIDVDAPGETEDDPFDRIVRSLAAFSGHIGECK